MSARDRLDALRELHARASREMPRRLRTADHYQRLLQLIVDLLDELRRAIGELIQLELRR